MKTISYALNVVLVCIISFMACSNLHGDIILPFDCGSDGYTGVTVRDFMRDAARYRDTHLELINNDIVTRGIQPKGFSDARSCWYPLDSLKKFICLMERYSSPLHLASGELGIRFYYTVYPQSKIWKEEYKNLHTLMLMPTYTRGEEHISFDPRHSALRAQNAIVDLKDMDPDEPLFTIDIGDAYERGISHYSIRNQGGLCPPTCSAPHEFEFIDSHFLNIHYPDE